MSSTDIQFESGVSDALMASFNAAIQCIDENQSFLVVSHENPDGDAVGSTLAMGLWLKSLGKDVTCFNVDSVPYNYEFLPGQPLWTTQLPADAHFDVTVMLDCGERHRVGAQFPQQGWGDCILMIDHHKSWDASLADIPVRDVKAAATGELIYQLIARKSGSMSQAVATCLYCCVMTDTGGFRYSSTSPKVLRIASQLLECGVSPWEMTSNIYENQPEARIRLISAVLQTLQRSSCGRLAFLTIRTELFEQTGATEEMTDGMINFARGISGVEVATQLRQLDEHGQLWRVSFRSRGTVDVSALAEQFGGGGHHNAAGCTVEGTPKEIASQLSHTLSSLLDTK